MSKQTIILDSTQIDAFLTCPMAWKLGHKDALQPVGEENREALMQGQYGHQILDVYYKSRARGLDINAAYEAGCTIQPPADFPLGKDKQAEVRNRLRDYTYTYANNDFTVSDPALVEVGFSHVIYDSPSYCFVLEGRMDIFKAQWNGFTTIVDHKFQVKTKSLYHKSIQFRNYALVAHEVDHSGLMLVINYIRLTKSVNENTLKREICSFTAQEHAVWKRRLINVYQDIADSESAQNYEQRWSSCSGKYNAPCQFTPLCEEWNPELIQIKKQQLYTQKQEWKPW